MGRLDLPDGKRVAVNLGIDFCAHCLWMGGMNMVTAATLARGEFCAEVGVPRLLALYDELGIRTTCFIPGHTLDTYPAVCATIQEHGHELGHHGYYHEDPRKIGLDTHRRLLEKAFTSFERFGVRPRGYRATSWDFWPGTFDTLEALGFAYDSTLMGRDITPYHPRRWEVHWERGSVAGRATSVLEIPVSWALDDFPQMAHVPGVQAGLADPEVWYRHHRAAFDFAYLHEGATYVPVVHPQTIGQSHVFMVFRRLLEYIAGHEGVWFATLGEIADAWVDDEEDLRLMALEDVGGIEAPPADSGLTERVWV